MTEIFFHFNAPDKVAYACRLLRKAVKSGAQLIVSGEREELSKLDAALWTFSALEFLPHCDLGGDAVVVASSPILLTDAPLAKAVFPNLSEGAPAPILVNFGMQIPEGFERFERLIELVGNQENDREAGRQRWKQYSRRGYSITRHDVAATPET